MSAPPALDDPQVWSQLVDAVQPASILVAIAWRMGDLRARMTPEDVWQETLLRAWQARKNFAWQGTPSFRRWLVVIAERCIKDQREHAHAQKRGAVRTVRLAGPGSSDGDVAGMVHFEPWASTTPSRIATERERASAMEQALATLSEEFHEVVRLRLFEDLQVQDIAEQLHLGESAVRHRFRKGAEIFHRRLQALLGGPDSSAGSPIRSN